MRPLVHETPTNMNDGFEIAVEPFLLDLRKYCLSLTNTKWDGEDLMQETLVKVYESWMKAPKQIVKAYLYRIASNTWIDKHRKRSVHVDINYDISNVELESKLHTDALSTTVEKVLKQLSSKQKAVVLLVLGFGHSIKETADMLTESEGSVKAALHRARKKLKQLDGFWAEEKIEDDTVLPYMTALNTGDSYTVVRLYQENLQALGSSVRNSNSVPPSSSPFQAIQDTNTPYMLISIPTKNGGVLIVPFYQVELSALLSQIAWLEQKELAAIA